MFQLKQECIPVVFAPSACGPYLPACTVPEVGVYLVPGGVYLVLRGVPGPRVCTWSGECTWSQGVPGLGGSVPGPGVYLVPGGCVPGPRGDVPGPRRCTWSVGVYLPRYSPPVDRITDACENIALPQLRCGR